MKIAVIGAGFTGLACAYNLVKKGHTVVVFEKDTKPGGLAIGIEKKEWSWTLEKHYHHWFTNDTAVLSLAKEIQFPVVIKKPHTNWYIHNKIYEFDSIKAALVLPVLPVLDRIRNLATLGLLRFNPFWKPLEKVNAHTMLPRIMGKKAYTLLWEPLFKNKFGSYASDISLAWFWARIVKRTPSLAYPKGGYLTFAEALVKAIEKKGGTIKLGTEITKISEKNDVSLTINEANGKKIYVFDKVIVTLPSFYFLTIASQLPEEYKKKLMILKGLGAINLVLRLKKPFFSNDTYWLSIADTTSPIMAIVEHTNFMDKKNYNNEHLVYLGNYLPKDHPYFFMTKEQLLKVYDQFLQKIHPGYEQDIIGTDMFAVPFAQPIIPTNYSKMIPPFKTPLKNVYLANMQQVYPWDRGTNYAVELGEKIAALVGDK